MILLLKVGALVFSKIVVKPFMISLGEDLDLSAEGDRLIWRHMRVLPRKAPQEPPVVARVRQAV